MSKYRILTLEQAARTTPVKWLEHAYTPQGDLIDVLPPHNPRNPSPHHASAIAEAVKAGHSGYTNTPVPGTTFRGLGVSLRRYYDEEGQMWIEEIGEVIRCR